MNRTALIIGIAAAIVIGISTTAHVIAFGRIRAAQSEIDTANRALVEAQTLIEEQEKELGRLRVQTLTLESGLSSHADALNQLAASKFPTESGKFLAEQIAAVRREMFQNFVDKLEQGKR